MRTVALLASVFALHCVPARAGLVSVKLVSHVEALSDTVIIGSLTDVSQNTASVNSHLRVLRVIKGKVLVGTVIPVSAAVQFRELQGPPLAGGPASLWFLKQNPSGVFALIPAQEGDVDLQHMGLYVESSAPAGSFAYAPTDSTVDMIVKEVSAFAEAEQCVEAEDAIVQSLQGIDTPTLRAALAHFGASPVTSIRAIGVAALIQRGSVEALLQFENDLGGPFGSAQFQRSTGMLNIVAAIDLLYRSVDPNGVQALGRLATSGSLVPRLTRASAHALRSIHTKESLPWLARLLESPDQALRYDGLFGFAAFANGFPIATADTVASMTNLTLDRKAPYAGHDTTANLPSFAAFAQNEAPYLNFWSNWWSAHKPALMP